MPSLVQTKDLTLLVVEDNRINQKVVTAQLNQLGFMPHLAVSGADGLHAAKRHPYDIILMDCELPDMDGLEVTRHIREHELREGLSRSFIVAVTAHSSSNYHTECKAAGMDDYISKPIRIEDLRNTLDKAKQRIATAHSSPKSGNVPAVNEFALDQAVVSDLQSLSGDGSSISISLIVSMFFEDAPLVYDQLTEGIQEGDLGKISTAAHKLAGSASLFGALKFSELCRQMESEARQYNLAGAREIMPDLKVGFEQTLLALEEWQNSLAG
ncbi:MAG: response regulator [Verrucomicrobiales bacterium]